MLAIVVAVVALFCSLIGALRYDPDPFIEGPNGWWSAALILGLVASALAGLALVLGRARLGLRRFPMPTGWVSWVASMAITVCVFAGLVAVFTKFMVTTPQVVPGRPPRRGWMRRRTGVGHRRHPERTGWSKGQPGARNPNQFAGEWSKAAAAEAESVGAFLELHAELVALGAPEDLRSAVLGAAADEVRHARRCTALAEVCGERPEPPDVGRAPSAARPVRSACERRARLARVAVESYLDGALNEGQEADRLARLAAVSAPPFGPIIADIAEDEARHARLGWTIADWAVTAGGRPVSTALAAAGWGQKSRRTFDSMPRSSS